VRKAFFDKHFSQGIAETDFSKGAIISKFYVGNLIKRVAHDLIRTESPSTRFLHWRSDGQMPRINPPARMD
jgi:hypothetical protein